MARPDEELTKMSEADLKLIIFTSFLWAIKDGVRAIAYDHSADLISIYGYLSGPPDNGDYDTINKAITEIMASCPQFNRQQIELIQTTEPVGRLNPYKGWIFVRCED